MAINIRGVELTSKIGLVITGIAAAVLVLFYVSAISTGAFSWDKLHNITALETAANSWVTTRGVGNLRSFTGGNVVLFSNRTASTRCGRSPRCRLRYAHSADMGHVDVARFILVHIGVEHWCRRRSGGNVRVRCPVGRWIPRCVWHWDRIMAVDSHFTNQSDQQFSRHHLRLRSCIVRVVPRPGYFPRWMSLTGKNHTPYVAIILGAGIGFACAVVIQFAGDDSLVGKSLISMAVFGAVISYAMVMLSFIKLRITRPNMPRPYRSPLGIPGAVVGLVLSLIALLATFEDEAARPGVWGVAIFVFLGIVYFFVYSRHHLVAQAPEEEDA